MHRTSHPSNPRRALLLAAALALASPLALAQSIWPSKPVTIVVPFPAGGGTDAFARPLNPQRMPQADLAAVRSNPGKYNYASAGNGTSHHLAGELFKLQSQTFITHIPYRGAGPALQDLIAGQVAMMFDGLGSSASGAKLE